MSKTNFNLSVCVLMRCKKNGDVDTVMTGMGTALMRLWAMQNTTSSKITFIFERESGKILYAIKGTKEGFPKIKDGTKEDLGTCEDIGISLEALQEAGYDERFDKEVQ